MADPMDFSAADERRVAKYGGGLATLYGLHVTPTTVEAVAAERARYRTAAAASHAASAGPKRAPTCEDCGTPVSKYATRCPSCASVHSNAQRGRGRNAC